MILAAALYAEPVQNSAPAASLKTVWDGVYTAEQAARGKVSYTRYCSECHEDTLVGGRGRPLVGTVFWRDWGEDTLDGLFNVMRTTMPRDDPASLAADVYLDVVSYILQVNEFPPGSEELMADATANILVVGREGPGPVPNFAIVQVVGCLTQDPDKGWILTNATAPLRTRNPKPSADVKAAEARPLGTGRFRLLQGSASQLDALKGHKVQAKGILIRMPNDDRINLTSVSQLSPECQP